MDADMSLPSAPTQQFLTIFLITLNWPVGSVIGNAAHAATAVLHKHRTEARVAEYLSDVEGMRKVVLETKNEASLAKVEAELTQRGILHHKWIEQPEGIAACIATAPYLRDDVKDSSEYRPWNLQSQTYAAGIYERPIKRGDELVLLGPAFSCQQRHHSLLAPRLDVHSISDNGKLFSNGYNCYGQLALKMDEDAV
ncbi:hypothetical protein CcCBS67573_g03869 [Chytriomyces confervae]|uniref:peptidyl-tRNA hydrolase n=1 Tax=Chytriomyces confervae TaxID=246404 RepID=A0A507FGV5_9FUNG|nr:hypothetical protein CcCBS67573_g03869 [Chytriomyces confervae]